MRLPLLMRTQYRNTPARNADSNIEPKGVIRWGKPTQNAPKIAVLILEAPLGRAGNKQSHFDSRRYLGLNIVIIVFNRKLKRLRASDQVKDLLTLDGMERFFRQYEIGEPMPFDYLRSYSSKKSIDNLAKRLHSELAYGLRQ
jgi:hypothetical protein